MKLGIIGLPQSGKTTIFNALTRGNVPTTMSGKMEVHTAVVDVPDPRVAVLSKMYNPKKTTYAKVTYADIAGLEGGGQGDIAGPLRNELGQMDGFIHVVRGFADDNVAHRSGSVDAARDIQGMDGELLLVDLIAIETKIQKLKEERGKGGRDKAEIEREQVLFERLHACLSDDKPLRALDLTAEERKALAGFQFLTLKPMLVVLNLGEGQAAPDVSGATLHARALALQGKLEMDIAQLPPEDAAVFMQEYGISEPSLNRMIRESYDLMGLLSFFTVGEDEVRAWTVRAGAAAPEAAGVIHTDLQKGFIRAEVAAYTDLSALGGMAEARNAGKLRLEGKDYIVQDGDILHVRFNL
ncbi:MAG: redox-regulated ATPase YchF [Chloroflexi bacterium]|nr:redox-regulated ATPase YchF [Chloroflexota bacterium]